MELLVIRSNLSEGRASRLLRRDAVIPVAARRRKPKTTVLVRSDQASQFTSMGWPAFLKHYNLEHSMSRRGNRYDNAVAESFCNLLKRERIHRKT